MIVTSSGVGRAGDDGAAKHATGLPLVGRGRLAKAEAALRRGLAIDEADRAPSASSHCERQVSAVANLGALRMPQGRYQDAEPLLERGLELGEKALGGPGSPGIAFRKRFQ